MKFYFPVFLAMVFLASGPISTVKAESLPQPLVEMIARAKARIKTIDMATFKKILDSKQHAQIIDVREVSEYKEGHIPGAINIPRGVIEFRIWALTGYGDKMDKDIELILYCSSGSRCSMAARSLQELGLTNVTAVDMKLSDWQDAGYPLTEPEFPF